MQLQKSDGLIVVDLQKDFREGGAIPVPGGHEIIPPVVKAIALFQTQELPIAFTRCWHPANHCSFEGHGGRWKPHCIQGTPGAELIDEVRMGAGTVFPKGQLVDQDAYSGFQGTSLHAWLRDHDVSRLFISGWTTNVCVLHTTLDGLKLGYQVILLRDGIAGIEGHDPSPEDALELMSKAGAIKRDVKWLS